MCLSLAVKTTRQCTVSGLGGPMGKQCILSISVIFFFFQFVVTGGIGCLSYKHPKKITVSTLCHRETEFLLVQ